MVMLEAARKRYRTDTLGGDHPFSDHPHFSPEAVEARRKTHARLRGGPASGGGGLHA